MKNKKDRLNKNAVILAIGRNKGIKTAIARDLGCTLAELSSYIRIHSELKPLLEDAKKEIVSLAEEELLKNLSSENETVKLKAIEFVLKTLGKSEYSTDAQVQVNVQSDSDINVQIQQLFK